MANVDQALLKHGYILPLPPYPSANYAAFTMVDSLLFVSGQLPFLNEQLMFTGSVVDEVSCERAKEAAVLCTLNILAQVKVALAGDWSRIRQCLRLGGFIKAHPDYGQLSIIMDEASQLMQSVLGEEIGAHSRTTVGVVSLPLDAMVEIEASFLIGE